MAATQIVELTQPNLYVHKFRGFLQISRSGEYVGRVSLDDVLALVVANPANTISLRLMDYLVNNNVPVVLAGKNYMPSSMVLPLSGYSHQYQVMQAQIQMSAPRKKRAWQAIVKSKIANQAQVLHLSTGLDRRLPHLVTRVRSGDPSNCEGQAARIYFRALFGAAFIRDRDASGINARLNYSYAIVRAAVARGMSAAGLHPTIGVHHKHPYNPLNLLEDLVEPFRPWADLLVWRSLKRD
ncbi:MAG: type II CRISPR-associated endonuclease Cas1, partial [Gammaproteobacteria bacterium]